MKFVSSNQTLVRGITVVQNAVGSPISNPIVENIFISSNNGKLTFVATNLNLMIKCEGEADIQEEGSVVLPSKIITGIIRDLPNADVSLSKEDETVNIVCGEFKARLKGQSGDLFPPFTTLSQGKIIKLKAELLKLIIKEAIICTSSESSRFELDGMKIELKDKVLKFASTDGRRLAVYTHKSEELPDIEVKALIPTRTLHEMARTLPDEGEVELVIEERKIQVTGGDTTIISNLLADNFPQYERIIPPPGDIKIVVNREEFSSALKRASNLINTQTNMLLIKVENDFLEFFTEREEIGGIGRDRVKATYQGDSMELRYNYKFIQDFLRVLECDEIEIELRDPKKPAIFRPKDDNDFRYVLMPLKDVKTSE